MKNGEKLGRLIILLSIAGVIGGENGCQKDYCVACKTVVGTALPTITTTPLDTPTGTITVTVTPTGTVVATRTGTLTVIATTTAVATVTPTAVIANTAIPSADGVVALSEIAKTFSREDAIKKAGTAKKTGNWLGRIADDYTDSDGDGYTDWLEKKWGSDPYNPESTPAMKLTKVVRTDDQDFDGLSNAEEKILKTDPKKADTDGDGCSDGAEYLSGTNPLVKDSIEHDSDGDCLSDEVEAQIGTNPNSRDSDGDKLSDALEVAIGTDPNCPDTDDDGILDWKELELGTDPLVRDE